MLRELERTVSKIFIWSDEKTCTVEAVNNKQNDIVYARRSRYLSVNVRGHYKHQKLVCAMVWAAVASDGSKFLLVFIDEGVKVKSQVFLNMLLEKVFHWLTETSEKLYLQTGRCSSSHSECDQKVLQGSFPRLLGQAIVAKLMS